MFTGPRITPLTASPTTESFLGFFTMTNNSTTSQSAESFQLAFPVASQSGSIRIYTSDTAGNSASALTTFGVDATSSDMTGAVRLQIISGVSAISGSQTLKFWVYDSPTAPPTGTAISSASLLSTSWRISASVNIGGTTHIVDTNTFGSATTSFSASQVVFHGAFMANPFRSCLVWSAPVQSGGQGMRLWFHTYVSKTASGTVSAANALLPADTDLVIRNMDAVRVTPSNYYYGLTVARATSMTDGTLITTDQTDLDGNVTRMVYARSSPSATITLSDTNRGFVNISRSAGSWDTDVLGAHIRPVTSSGTAGAYVVSRTSGTTVSAYIYSTVSSTSFTSGNWAQEGVGHPYGSTWTMRVVVGVMPTCAVAIGNHTNAVTPTTVAGMNYLSSVKAMNNYAFTASAVSFNMTDLNAMRADNAIRPFTQIGPEDWPMGDVETDIGQASDRADIGMNPSWAIDGIALPTGNGRRKMAENSGWYHCATYLGARRYSGSPAAGALGVVMRPDCGTQYSFDTRWGTLINSVASWSPYDGDTGHEPGPHYLPYLYFGRLIYLERMQEATFYGVTSAQDPTYSGSGINQTPMGDATGVISSVWGANQQRSIAWTWRDLIYTTFCTPDSNNDLIYNAKSCYTAWMDNCWERLAWGMAAYTDQAAPNNFYTADGPRWLGQFGNWQAFAPWQTRYVDWVYNTAIELGLTGVTTSSFVNWMSIGYVGMSQNANVVADWLSTAYYVGCCAVDGNRTIISRVQNWTDTYQCWALWPPGYEESTGGGNWRTASGTVTLSTTSGTITVTAPGGFLNTGAFYDGAVPILGGWAYGWNGVAGRGQITAVANSSSFTINTSVTGGQSFTTTSITGDNFHIPLPAPADKLPNGTLTGRDSTYMELYRLGGIFYMDRGIASASACVTYIEGSVGFPATIKNKLNINSR